MMKSIRHTLSRMKDAGYRRSDLLILAFFIIYVAFMVMELSANVTLEKGILLGILSFFMLQIFYEFTFKRAQVPTMATGFFEIKKIVQTLKKDYEEKNKTDYHIIDCGSGNGEMTRRLAKAMPHAQVLGIETATIAYHLSCFLKKLMGLHNLAYLRKDFFTHDCSSADAVVIFLNGRLTELLGEKLRKELKPGAMVICNEFELKGVWLPPEVITMHTPFEGRVFIYRR